MVQSKFPIPNFSPWNLLNRGKHFSKKISISLVLVILAIILATNLKAQNRNTGLSVHPSNFDMVLEPGKPIVTQVTLDNLTREKVSIKVSRKNFTATGEEGAIHISDEDSSYALAKWIKVEPENALIDSKKSQVFTITVTAPKNAEPGGHFGSLVFSTVADKRLNTTGAALSQEVASIILARIPGNANEKAVLESFNTDKHFYEFGPVSFTARIKNEGSVHIRPQGEVLLTDMFGQKLVTPFEARNILPGATRKVPATLKDHMLIGKYTAYVIMGYGTTNQQLAGTTTFYAFPVRYGIVGLGILIIFFLMRKRFAKAFKALISGK